MKKLFLMGAFALGLMSFSTLEDGMNCIAVADAALEEGRATSRGGGMPEWIEDWLWESAYHGCNKANGIVELDTIIVEEQ